MHTSPSLELNHALYAKVFLPNSWGIMMAIFGPFIGFPQLSSFLLN